MSVGYTEYVLPEVSVWHFRPSRTQLGAILESLEAGDWLLGEGGEEADFSAYVSLERARELLRSASPDQSLTFLLEASGGADEWPDEQPELTPEVCQDIRIIDSPTPLIVPAGEADLSLPCPDCAVDILEAVGRASQAAERDELAAYGFHELPPDCPSCKAALSPADLAMFSHDERIDDVPLFHFCVALAAAVQPGEAWTNADPALLSSLASATGVRFRSMGRWA